MPISRLRIAQEVICSNLAGLYPGILRFCRPRIATYRRTRNARTTIRLAPPTFFMSAGWRS
jgi:hypothetical protein